MSEQPTYTRRKTTEGQNVERGVAAFGESVCFLLFVVCLYVRWECVTKFKTFDLN